MRVKTILPCLLICVFFASLLPSAALGEDFAAYAEPRFERRGVVGGAVIISRNGEVLCSYAYGWANVSRTRPVTLDTCFRIASVTKLVTTIGLVKLMEENNLSYDTDISDILGYTARNPAFPDTPITVRNVLTHTTGLVTGFSFHPTWDQLPVENRYFDPNVEAGTKYIYANFNGGLMGAMIEALSGQSLNTYMTENVFEPLGINAAYHPGLLKDQSSVANRMTNDGHTFASADAEIATLPDYNDVCDPVNNTDISVGGLYISANGMNRLITMLQLGGTVDGIQILPEGTVEKMMACQVFEGSSVYVDAEYALGLARVYKMPGGTWYGHQGRRDGLTSNMYFQPDTGLTVSVIANGYEAMSENKVVTIARAFMEYAYEHFAKE